MGGRGLTVRSLALTGVTGVVLAHALDYVAVFPHGHARSEELAATGHGYWPLAVTAALGAGVAVLVGAARRGWRDGRTGARSEHGSLHVLAALAAWQLILFVGIEVVERATAGVDPLVLGRQPEFWVGLAVQVAVAAAVVMVLRSVHGAARQMAAARARRPRSRVRVRWVPGHVVVLRSISRRRWQTRAPPLGLV